MAQHSSIGAWAHGRWGVLACVVAAHAANPCASLNQEEARDE